MKESNNKIMDNKENIKNNLESKLEVPYYSQYLDIPNDTLKAVRACGITCVKMCLDYFDKNSDSLLKFLEDGIKVDENRKLGFGT